MKKRNQPMKYWQTTFAVLAVLVTQLAVAEDFKTLKGKEYKNVTVSRVEPDGIVLKTKSGISKLPKEVQQRFHYDALKAAEFNRELQVAITQSNARVQQDAAEKR